MLITVIFSNVKISEIYHSILSLFKKNIFTQICAGQFLGLLHSCYPGFPSPLSYASWNHIFHLLSERELSLVHTLQ